MRIPFDPDPGALVLGIVTDIKVIPKRNDPYIWGLNRDMVLCRYASGEEVIDVVEVEVLLEGLLVVFCVEFWC